MKVCLFGSYSGYNKGDLGILTSFIENMHSVNNNVKLCVPSKKPINIQKYIKRKNVSIYKTLTPYIGLKSIKYINEADAIVFGGGGLFFDRSLYNPFSSHLANLFILTYMNKHFFKKKIYIFSVGASHLKSRLSIILTTYILNNVDVITVRDNHTKLLFSRLTKKPIEIFYDPAFLLHYKREKMIDNYITRLKIKKNKLVLVSLNSSLFKIRTQREGIPDLVDMLIKLQNDFSVVLYQNDTSMKFINKLYPLCNRGNIYIFNKTDLSPSQIIYLFKKFDFVISAPMHSSLFAYNAGVKIITINYDDKVTEFNKIVGNKNNVSLNNISRINQYCIAYHNIDYSAQNKIKMRAYQNFTELNMFLGGLNKKE